VMPGVRLLGRPEEFCGLNVWRRRVAKHADSSVTGHDGRPGLGAGWWREAWRGLEAALHAAGGVAGAKGDAI
jgi:hypothetical protein